MEVRVDPDPLLVGPSQLAVRLTDADGKPVEGAEVRFQAAMGQAGTPLRAKAKPETGGEYTAPFVWTMAGDWTLAVTATLPGGGTAARELKLHVAEGAMEGMHGHDEAAHHHASSEGAEAHDHMGHHHAQRVPNHGATIQIVSPAEGATFKAGSDVKVEIRASNFHLGEDGNHWHLYVDGMSAQMIMGKMTTATVRGLTPGQHEIAVYLSNGKHEELEDGATVTITVTP